MILLAIYIVDREHEKKISLPVHFRNSIIKKLFPFSVCWSTVSWLLVNYLKKTFHHQYSVFVDRIGHHLILSQIRDEIVWSSDSELWGLHIVRCIYYVTLRQKKVTKIKCQIQTIKIYPSPNINFHSIPF